MKISEQLREAFLNGREIIGYKFAKEIGTTGSSISKAMKAFGPLVQGHEVPATVSNLTHIKVWRCVDLEGMSKWRPTKVGPTVESQPEMRADALAQVWGIRMADIPLPSHKHEMRGAWA